MPDRLLVEWSSEKYPGGIPKNFPSKVEGAFHALNYGLFENKISRCSVRVDDMSEKIGRDVLGQAGLDRKRAPIILSEPQYYYEIVMNYHGIERRSFMDELSTLAHEMCHVHEFLHSVSVTDHSPYWADLMRTIGLTPYALKDSNPCEKGIGMGDRVTHRIDDSGAFKRIARQLIGEYSFGRY